MDAEAKEREKGFKEHHLRDGEREVDDDDAEDVGNEMAEDDAPAAGADGAGGFNKLFVLQRDNLAADDAGHGEPVNCADDKEENGDAIDADGFEPGFHGFFAENGDEKNYDEDKRDGIEDIDEAHHDVVDVAAEIAGDGAVGDADDERDEGGDEADDQ